MNGKDTIIQIRIDTTTIHEIILPEIITSVHQRPHNDSDVVLEVYPNPSSSKISVIVETQHFKAGLLQIIDAAGRKWYSKRHSQQEMDNTFNIDISKMAPGTY